MKPERRSALLCIFLSLMIVMFAGASLTFARYSDETQADGIYSGSLDFVVSEQIEIRSVDEFFTAIENGYTNIKIADEVDNPLIVTGGVSDVNSDLTIDLNGHELQRNNREPLLNVTSGVRLTVIDSSAEKNGCFYNPVGSVLAISGGTLTVTGGIFESGPRNGVSLSASDGKAHYSSEYATGGGTSWSTPAGASVAEARLMEVFRRDDVTGDYPETGTAADMPVIEPVVISKEESGQVRYTVNGNMYFDENTQAPMIGIGADTYLYFTLEGDNIDSARIAASTASAEFYYSYYMKRVQSGASVSYEYADAEGEDTVLVTVYGYEKTKAKAQADSEFSAIHMEGGNLYVRGGQYSTYFGEAYTYCVLASGGYMAVEAGVFEAQRDSVCVNVSYDVPKENEYLRVARGSFYSQVGDTVQVSGGRMAVTSGAFYKDASGGTAVEAGGNNAAIRIDGGELNVSGSAASPVTFSLKGSCLYGIRSEVSDTGATGTVTVTNAAFTFNDGIAQGNGTNYGISSGGGTVTVNGCSFLMPDENSRGISATSGTVNVNGAGGGNDGDTYSYFYIDKVAGCYGVYAGAESGTSGSLQVNVNAAQFFMGQNAGGALGEADDIVSGAGIYMDASGAASKVSLRKTLIVASGNGSCGVYARRGNIEQTSGKLVAVTGALVQGYQSGVTKFQPVESYTAMTDLLGEGRVVRSGASYGYGVYSGGGTIQLNSVFSAVYGQYSAGILAMSNDTASGADVSVASTFESIVSIGSDVGGILSGTAINTENSDVKLLGSSNISTDALGITARGGNVTFGQDGGAAAELLLTSTRGTALYVNGGNVLIESNVATTIESTIEEGFVWAGRPARIGDTAASQTNGVYVQGGSVTAKGSFRITHSGLNNVAIEGARDLMRSYAVRVDGSADVASSFTADDATITVPEGAHGGGLYVNSGTIVLDKATVTAEGFGIAMRSTSSRDGVTVNDSLKLTSRKATGIYITGGSLLINGAADITSEIDADYPFCSSTSKISYDGVYVQGGSLTANAAFNVTHKGLSNDNQFANNPGTLYYTFKIKSYAVRVEGAEGQSTSVSLAAGSLTNTRGGGLYVSGGNVTLNSVSASATGYDLQGDFIQIPGADSNWQYKQSLTGGNAVELDGGTLIVNGGTYTAAQGNGILVRGGTANIYGGSFYGNDVYKINSANVAGAAASYSFKMYGGTANIYGGTFGKDSSGSGAFFMGTAADARADANIYGGSFEVRGQAGVSIYQYADVLFAPRGGENGAGGDIAVAGDITAVAIEITKNGYGYFDASRAPSVKIDGGTFKSTTTASGAAADGIWCGNRAATLTIGGGTFTGSVRYGLFIESGASVTLSGGSYQGPLGAINGAYSLASGYKTSWSGNTMSVVPSA